MWSVPDGLELLLPSRSGESWDGPNATWLPLLGLLLSGTGELWDIPSTAWPGVLLTALCAGARLLSRRVLGRL